MESILISKNEIDKILTMKDVIYCVEKTFSGFGEGTVENPPKVNLDLGIEKKWMQYNAGLNAMPAYIGWQKSAGLKWAGGWLDNPKKGLPFINAIILLVDPENGHFKAVLEGSLITNMRTGAQSAVASKYLTNKRDITLGLYGCGVQGFYQIKAFAEIFNIKELKLFDINPEAAENLAKNIGIEKSNKCTVSKKPEENAEADIVVSVTHATNKYIQKSWLNNGTIVFPLGSYLECSDELILTADKIIVDHIGQCLHRGALKDLAEKGRITEKNIFATIGEVVSGKKPAFITPIEQYVCIPIGTGAMDVSVASFVYEKVKKSKSAGKYTFI